MTELFSFDDNYPGARAQLHEAVNNLDYLAYAINEGPLEIDEVVASRRMDNDFIDAANEYGWPDIARDGEVKPVISYATDQEFMESLKPSDEYGKAKLISNYFFSLLRQDPIKPNDKVTNCESAYRELGKILALHRAHALAPDLFDNLRITLNEIVKQYRELRPVDVDHIDGALHREENQEIMQAIHMSYRILGRLLKRSDVELMPDVKADAAVLEADHVLRGTAS